MKHRFVYLFLIALSVVIIRAEYLFYYPSTDFHIESITSPLSYHPEWDIHSLSLQEESKLRKILDQQFHYLGKGGQIYAFESEDKRYVLKFLKFKYLKPRLKNQLISLIPFFEDWQTNEMQRRHRKFNGLYKDYKWAYQLNKENSGLLFLHFNPTFNQFGPVVLFDKHGLKHSVELDQVAFVIQEKGILLDTVLTEKLNNGEIAEAQAKINAILDMYLRLYEKGLYDRDYGVAHNTAFVGDRPIHIDMGRISLDEKMKQKCYYKSDLVLVSTKISEWIKKRYPQFHSVLSKSIEDKLNSILDVE